MENQNSFAIIASADESIERGNYVKCLELLKPLSELHPISTTEGSKIRQLMTTALIGLGKNEEALTICQLLIRSGDPELRQHAKQLLSILEAPILQRPDSWSMQLPTLEFHSNGSYILKTNKQSLSDKTHISVPPPPTGLTKSPTLGFSALVATVLIGLTILLSGCVHINADVSSPGPNLLQLSWKVESNQPQLIPWQLRFEKKLKNELPKLKIQHPEPGQQLIYIDSLPSQKIESIIIRLVELAGRSAGLTLPAPKLKLQERNWLVGVNQNLELKLDLGNIPDIPGLEIIIELNHGSVRRQINIGETLNLQFTSWRWNNLGIGGFLVAVLLGISLFIQNLRHRLGFGFPELPA